MARAVKARLVFLADDYAGYEVRGLLAQHGLSVLVEVVDHSGRVHRVLFDTGQYGEAIVHNARLLGVDLGSVEAIALSHNHYDHTGGLLEVLRAIGRRVPVVAHPDVFKPSIHIRGDRVRLNIGIPYSRRELEDAGADFLLLRTPLEIAPGVYWLGEIERRYPDLAPGLPGAYTVSNDGELAPHPLRDDTGLAIVVENYGAIVIGGCSHSGIANIASYAAKVTGETPRLVTGGFHMVALSQDKIMETIKVFRDLGVEEVHTGHCTGLQAECILAREYGKGFRKIHAGYAIEITG
ncbi:7,8-dihydropterin-6-methyl-4-(beta-D-ribofuranosy l)-aminobenzene-5'-phosphate synthase [Pyrofollis japonicus]|uniref:MBL fold metallo-hydrolase n=1 Tax=Pyrofollis japonicus TaxID=3060460 RepID=UPI00295B4D2A|nr:MBL fold metallo-hydrolase [Pyrofollis japonicus]BEP16651.1 7,8-dihydropterin-6-methyl-4-(beta-D-ribofuranosy l)-aminobenzene-5'-phosphate synthase [Pyrofollis japonicus]